MKKLLVAGLAAAACCGAPALAADMPVKAPPLSLAPAPAASWTGCHVDAGAGYGLWNQDHFSASPEPGGGVTVPITDGGHGWLGRFGGGCDYQFSAFGKSFVIGALADYDVANLSGSNRPELGLAQPPNGFVEMAANEKEAHAWAVGPRIGYLITPTLLTYVDGGYTEARFDQMAVVFTNSAAWTGYDYPAQTYHGWFVGAGTEASLATVVPGLPNGWNGWFLRGEYRYARYQPLDLPLVSPGGLPTNGFYEHIQPSSVQTVTTSLVWRFNWNAAATADTPLPAGMPLKALRAPAAPSPAANWTGCYVDAGVGGGLWNQDHHTEAGAGLAVATTTTTDGGRGWLGRFGGGCDYQLSANYKRFVIGALADYDVMNLKGTNSPSVWVGFGPQAADERESGSWGVGGRIGYLVVPGFLAYGDAGYTQARFGQMADFFTATGGANGAGFAAHSYQGWFLGGGTEASLATLLPGLPKRLLLRTEYRYAGYPAVDLPQFTFATGAPTGIAEHISPSVQTVTASLVWRFN